MGDEGAATVAATGPEVAPYVVEPESSSRPPTRSRIRPRGSDPAGGAGAHVDAPVPIGARGSAAAARRPADAGLVGRGRAAGRGVRRRPDHRAHGAHRRRRLRRPRDPGQGDRVEVRTASGTLAYAVTGVTIYRKSTLAHDAQRVFSQTGPGRLVLITCEDWNGSGYLSNAVVFAERTP